MGLIRLCDARTRRSNLCELVVAHHGPRTEIFVDVRVRERYHVPIHTMNVAGQTVNVPESWFLYKRTRQNPNCRRKVINRAAHISKQKSVGSDPKPVTHKTLKSVLCQVSRSSDLAGGGISFNKIYINYIK